MWFHCWIMPWKHVQPRSEQWSWALSNPRQVWHALCRMSTDVLKRGSFNHQKYPILKNGLWCDSFAYLNRLLPTCCQLTLLNSRAVGMQVTRVFWPFPGQYFTIWPKPGTVLEVSSNWPYIHAKIKLKHWMLLTPCWAPLLTLIICVVVVCAGGSSPPPNRRSARRQRAERARRALEALELVGGG